MSVLHIIGGLSDKTIMDVDYAEAPESGKPQFRNRYDSNEYGWMRKKIVTAVYVCFRKDIDTVLAALPSAPSSLTTNPGKNADGTIPARVNWGSGYVLQGVNSNDMSPSLVKLTCQYVKEIAEASEVYPNGLTTTCAASRFKVLWQSVVMKDMGDVNCSGTGLEFIKGRQIKRRCTVYTPNAAETEFTVQEYHRWYNPLDVRVDDTVFETFYVLDRESPIGQATTEDYDAGQDQEVIIKDTTLGSNYGASLQWETIDTTTCRLLWCDQAIWDFNV